MEQPLQQTVLQDNLEQLTSLPLEAQLHTPTCGTVVQTPLLLTIKFREHIP